MLLLVLEAGLEPAQPQWPKDFKSFVSTIPPFERIGAKNGTRTRDPNLGKVMLYQLSYFRNCVCKYKTLFFFWQISFTKIIKSERSCRRAGVAFPDLSIIKNITVLKLDDCDSALYDYASFVPQDNLNFRVLFTCFCIHC